MSLDTKILFVRELIAHLHRYGTSAGRLESAVSEVTERIGLDAHILASATGCWLSVEDPEKPERPITHILRLPVGTVDLGRLSDCDRIAYDVAEGKCEPEEGLRRLRHLDRPDGAWRRLLLVLCCGMASMGVPALFSGTGYADLSASFILGLVTGMMILLGGIHWRVGESMEALAAFLVTLLALMANTLIAPLSLNVVIVAGLIALMPGLALTTAISELSAGQLMTGVARFGGSVVTLMKLTFGAAAAVGVSKVAGWNGGAEGGLGALAEPVRMVALLACALSFAGIFRAKLRDSLTVAGSVLLGHYLSVAGQQMAQNLFGVLPVGTFIAATAITVLSNVYSSVFHRPGAVIRLPGIIMLVPGSIGFKAGQMLWSNNIESGGSFALAAVSTVVAIVAGILIGNLLVAARRKP